MDTRHDTTFTNLDSLRYYYNLKSDLDADMMNILSYLEEKDFSTATSKLSILQDDLVNYPIEFRSELQDFINYITVMINVLSNPSDIAELNQENFDALDVIARNGSGLSKHYAENVLCFFYGNCDYRLIQIPSSMGQYVYPANENEDTTDDYFILYPNPTAEGVVVQLNFEINSEINIVITDFTGKIVQQTTTMKNTYIYDTRRIESGIYFVSVFEGGRFVESKKLIVQH